MPATAIGDLSAVRRWRSRLSRVWSFATAGWCGRVLVVSLLMALLYTLWLPLLPYYLFDFDSANFALALDNFNPARHQPQPPGYPLLCSPYQDHSPVRAGRRDGPVR